MEQTQTAQSQSKTPRLQKLQQAPKPAKYPTDRVDLKGAWFATGITWPGHFSGTTSLKVNQYVSEIYMCPITMPGMIMFRDRGVLGATNGVTVVELEEVNQ